MTINASPATQRSGSVGISESPSSVLRAAVSNLIPKPALAVSHAWNRFWYSPSDPTVLCFIRLLAGGMLLYTHVVWGLNLPAFLGSAGWNSPDVLAVVQEGQMVPSFWWYVPDNWQLAVHCACIGVLVLFWIGFVTRVTSVLSMIITISYSYRAHMSNFGLDQINAILCLYLCIGPSGAVLSVDRWIAVWRAKRQAVRRYADFVVPRVKPSTSANLAIRLTQIHFCVIYAYAGLSKLQGGAWWSGEAVWLAFANLEYQSVSMTWTAWYPWISDLMTHSTIIWEVSFPALVWVRPVRPFVLLIGFGLHAGIGGMMGMWTFGLIMIFGHVSFWPVMTVHSIASHLPLIGKLLGSAPVTASGLIVATAALPVPATATIQPTSSLPEQTALLLVDRAGDRRLKCLQYFWGRGFRCQVSANMHEAQTVRNFTSPDAIVLMGAELPDDDVVIFHYDHFSRPNAQPLFLIVSKPQSQRLNGRIQTPGCYVITGNVNLGKLRRIIEETLSRVGNSRPRYTPEHIQQSTPIVRIGVN